MAKGRKINWKETIGLLRRARLPWVHFALSSIIPFLTTYIYVYLPELEGRIASGEIFDTELIQKYVFFSVLLLLLNITTFYSAWVEIQFDRRVQKFTWKKLLFMPMRTFEKVEPSSLITRITDDATYVSALVNYILGLILTLYSAVLMIASLFRMSTRLALYTVPVLLLNFVFVLIARTKGYDVGYTIQEAVSRYTSFLSERVHALPLIKASGTEPEEAIRGRTLSAERKKVELRALWYEIVIAITMEVTNIGLVGFVLIGGALEVRAGNLSMESLITFYILAMALPNTTQELLFQILKLQQFHGSVEVIADLSDRSDAEHHEGAALPALSEGIAFQNVSFRYPRNEGAALKDMDFFLPKGKVTAIVGPTGSGKTTILKLLERFYEVDEGTITYDGTPIEEFSLSSWRNMFGYVVQNSPLLTGTVRSNILYGADRDLSDEELMDIARMVQLDDFIQSNEEGLDTPIEGNGLNISGGQRQRIAIARALAADPKILILDEATANLDAHNVASIHRAIMEQRKDRTIIMVAHQMHTVRHADQILVIADGTVQDCGDHATLINTNAYYRRSVELRAAGQ